MARPQPDARHIDETHKPVCSFVATSGPPTAVLQPVEAPLDHVAPHAAGHVDRLAYLSVLAHRDHRQGVAALDICPDFIKVMAHVGVQNRGQRLAFDHHKTIAEFRRTNGLAIRQTCAQFVELCRLIGVLKGDCVAIDGSKFKAVNNRDKNFTKNKIATRSGRATLPSPLSLGPMAQQWQLWTREGWVYLAVIIDLFSRRVIGWAISNRMKQDLAIRALKMAVALRRRPAFALYQKSPATYSDPLRACDTHADVLARFI